MRLSRLLVSAGLGLTLVACATAPEPEPILQPMVTAPPVQPDPRPEIVTEAPLPDPTPAPFVDPNLPAPGSIADFAYRAGGDPRIYFGYDQFTLTPEARNSLSAQASWLKSYGNVNAIIEGHADERGTREYNLALGARRAEAVKAFLVSQGVSAARLTTVSYGKERPIDGRSNEEGWARNRNGFTNITINGIS